jgi:hypothetical protein
MSAVFPVLPAEQMSIRIFEGTEDIHPRMAMLNCRVRFASSNDTPEFFSRGMDGAAVFSDSATCSE